MKITPESIEQACKKLCQVLIEKNEDYDNSFEELFNEYGITSLNIRLDDKRKRFKNLTKKKKQGKVKEKLSETVLDEGGYAVLAYILLCDIENDNPHRYHYPEKKPPYADIDDE